MVGEPTATALLRWIPLLPLAAAVFQGVLLGLFRRPLGRNSVVLISCGSVIASFALSFWALIELTRLPASERAMVDELFTWIGSGRFSAEASLLLDPLSAVMILVVTAVGALIHVYSVGYMEEDHREDRGFQRFFCYLNLFTFSMLVLVLADNLVLMFLGWEGVGLCSYLLIGFWYSDRANAYSGSKAFIVNRIGDFGFLCGIFLTFWAFAGHPDVDRGTVRFLDLARFVPLIAEQTVTLPAWLHFMPGAPEWRLTTLIGLCFFAGAIGKSAQLPLYVWLPDAMAGPTPVSALIHAATMVTAGVYMVCRLGFLYAVAPGASVTIAWIGGLTALFGATIALVQTDIKKVLAYSTVSQLGYMFLAAGCGAYAAAMFHVVTHAFFKALLFLGAGAVILATHHEQDTEAMGGLRRLIPTTHALFGLGVLAILGFPYTSGFFSKDEVLFSAYMAHAVPGHTALYAIGVVTAGLSAFYMCRLHFRVFFGESRIPLERRTSIAEPGRTVLVPLIVLGFLSVFGGFLGPSEAFVPIEDANSFANFLAPVLGAASHANEHATERRLALLAVLVAALGAGLAYLLYVRQPELPRRIAATLPSFHGALFNKLYVDELFDAILVRPLVAISDKFFYRSVDAGVIDRVGVEGTGRAVRAFAARALKYLQSGLTQAYLILMVAGALAIVGYLLGQAR